MTSAFSRVRNTKHRDQIRSGCLSLAFSGAQKRAELVSNPRILGDPQRQAQGGNQKLLAHPGLLAIQKGSGIPTQHLHFRGSPTPSARRKSELAASTLPSSGPKRGHNCYVALAFSGVPNAKRGEEIRSGCLTPAFYVTPTFTTVPNARRGEPITGGCRTHAFLGAQKRAELLRTPCILGGPQHEARGGNQKWWPQLCLLGAQEGGSATQPPAFSGVANTKRREPIIGGCLTPALSVAQKAAQLLRHPCNLRGPQSQARR